MEQQLETLTQLGTEAVQAAITHYTHWFVVAAICWLVVGVACAIAAVFVWRKRDKSEMWEEAAYIGASLLGLLAVTAVACNLPTLLYPKAYAIHQLIKDAR